MCDECVKFDQKIDHFRRMIARVQDPLTSERVGKLIDEMLAKKAALHLDENQRDGD
jgi:hypothetical protein